MREPGASRLLARRADVIPDVHGHERDAVILVQDHVQPVRQRELGVTDLERPRRRRRTAGLLGENLEGKDGKKKKNPRHAESTHRSLPTVYSLSSDMLFPRAPRDLQPNRLTQAVDRARAQGRPLIDLTLTNPTRAGLHYPPSLLAPLGSSEALVYDPSPFGLKRARTAVAADYARRGVAVDPNRIVLTASTSEAYSLLFKLLCATSGDEVLVPVPSYPLFDHLTQLDGVTAKPYRLDYHGRWCVDLPHVDEQWSDATRAVLAVSPNNPTGSILSTAELQALAARCARRRAALIVDEVFADYPIDDGEVPTLPVASSAPGRRASADLFPRRAVEVRGAAASETRMDTRARA